MRDVAVTLVVLNLADVAVDWSLKRPALIGTDVLDGESVKSVVSELVTDSGIVNYASPKLVGVIDTADNIEIVYRVRTASRALAKGFLWQSVDAKLHDNDRKLLELALSEEKP